MSGTLAPTPKFTGFDNNGAIIPGGKLFTYTAGTTTKVNTYADVGLTTANTNPIILDAAGRATIFLTPGVSYKFVLSPSTDTDPPTAPIWTQDNISAVPLVAGATDVLGTAGENITLGQAVFLSDGSGALTAGRWYKANATNTYSSTTAPYTGFAVSSITSGDVGTIRIGGQVTGLAGLSGGTTYYIDTTGGQITSSAPANARKILVADSTTTGFFVLDAQYTQSALDSQTFSSSGTWTMPTGATWVRVICYGAGGGGGGAGTVAAGSQSSGGGGGGGGARTERLFRAADITSPVTVTVGAGGAGGATGGNVGVAGGNTTFGTYLTAYGGGRGTGTTGASSDSGGSGGGSGSAGQSGGSSQTSGGKPGGTIANQPDSTSDSGGGGSLQSGKGGNSGSGGGGGGGASDGTVSSAAGGSCLYGGSGGGGGGGVTAANVIHDGYAGGLTSPSASLAAGGGGTAGVAGAAFNAAQNGAAGGLLFAGSGGGGGGGRRDGTAAAAGGAGGLPAGGGGGGGGGQNGSAGGAGGNGADGACYVITEIGLSQ